MKLIVAGGRVGAQQAADRGRVAIVVDALRASATTASLLTYGVREIIVVEDVEQAFAERERRPGSWLAGERGGLKVAGFDLGNSPLTGPVDELPETVVFSSSNMSRCCVGAAACPATFLGTLPTLTACASVAYRTAARLGCDIQLIPAGSVLDENKLVLEDYLTAGALIREIVRLSERMATPAEDPAQAALVIEQAARGDYVAAFLSTDNGRSLSEELGFGSDVRFAAQVNTLSAVPRVVRTETLPGGTIAAVLGME